MINRQQLLAFCDGDDQMAQSFLDMFKVEAEEALQQMPKYLDSSSWKDLSNLAHKLKSHGAYIGAKEMVSRARKLEAQCDREISESIKPTTEELMTVVKALIEEI